MPRGGKRAGAGRKPGSVAKRHKVIVEDSSGLMPVEWMLAVLRDPEAEQNRRDQMAALAAPYLHPRLNAVAVSSHGNGNNRDHGDVNILQVFAVPKGTKIERDGTALTIEGAAVELKPVEPFVGTPPLLTDKRDHNDQRAEPIERERFEVTELEVPKNVTRLDTFKTKRDDDNDSGPGERSPPASRK